MGFFRRVKRFFSRADVFIEDNPQLVGVAKMIAGAAGLDPARVQELLESPQAISALLGSHTTAWEEIIRAGRAGEAPRLTIAQGNSLYRARLVYDRLREKIR